MRRNSIVHVFLLRLSELAYQSYLLEQVDIGEVRGVSLVTGVDFIFFFLGQVRYPIGVAVLFAISTHGANDAMRSRIVWIVIKTAVAVSLSLFLFFFDLYNTKKSFVNACRMNGSREATFSPQFS